MTVMRQEERTICSKRIVTLCQGFQGCGQGQHGLLTVLSGYCCTVQGLVNTVYLIRNKTVNSFR